MRWLAHPLRTWLLLKWSQIKWSLFLSHYIKAIAWRCVFFLLLRAASNLSLLILASKNSIFLEAHVIITCHSSASFMVVFSHSVTHWSQLQSIISPSPRLLLSFLATSNPLGDTPTPLSHSLISLRNILIFVF